jgi:hypothetical protein
MTPPSLYDRLYSWLLHKLANAIPRILIGVRMNDLSEEVCARTYKCPPEVTVDDLFDQLWSKK